MYVCADRKTRGDDAFAFASSCGIERYYFSPSRLVACVVELKTRAYLVQVSE